MGLFQGFRAWLEDAPATARAGTGAAALVLAAMLGWLLVPPTPPDEQGVATAVSAATGDAAPQAGPAEPAPGAGAPAAGIEPGAGVPGDIPLAAGADAAGSGPVAGPAGPAGPAAPSGSAGVTAPVAATGAPAAACPGGTDQGVTSNQIKIAILVVDLAGPTANSAFNLPSAEDQEAIYGAVAADINARGGVACHKLALQYFRVNPTDDSQKQSQCLAVASAKPFAAVDAGGFGGSNLIVCIPSKQIPFFSYTMSAGDLSRFFPYGFALSNNDKTNRTGVLGLGQLGAYDPAKGFQKLGFIFRNCFPDLIATMRQAQRKAGVPADKVSEYDVGCGTAFASPADLQQAVLKFRRDGVTHMMTGEFLGDFANFTRIAQQQGFRPKWVLTDDQIPVSANGALAPDADNLDGAVLVTSSRYGEENVPNLAPTPVTQRCNAVFAAAKLPPVYRQPAGFGGRACSQLWMLEAAIAKAPQLQRTALAEGLRRAGSTEFSFPHGPNDFRGERVTYGGQSWRPITFSRDCRCWRVGDPNFRAGLE